MLFAWGRTKWANTKCVSGRTKIQQNESGGVVGRWGWLGLKDKHSDNSSTNIAGRWSAGGGLGGGTYTRAHCCTLKAGMHYTLSASGFSAVDTCSQLRRRSQCCRAWRAAAVVNTPRVIRAPTTDSVTRELRAPRSRRHSQAPSTRSQLLSSSVHICCSRRGSAAGVWTWRVPSSCQIQVGLQHGLGRKWEGDPR